VTEQKLKGLFVNERTKSFLNIKGAKEKLANISQIDIENLLNSNSNGIEEEIDFESYINDNPEMLNRFGLNEDD
jgi:hypothetical protein